MKLPIHWKWWPAIGGLAVGLGGLIFPQALGVGYDTIQSLLQGDVPRAVIAGVLLVKSAIWVISLGSGTSGGVLAPLLMMGAAMGGVEAMFLPNEGAGFWPLVSMGAILAGTMRAPFTAILFALELTHDINVLLPLLVAAMLAHATTVLLLKRSILTEKVARRGFHLTPRVCDRSAGNSVCTRSDANQTGRAAGRGDHGRSAGYADSRTCAARTASLSGGGRR